MACKCLPHLCPQGKFCEVILDSSCRLRWLYKFSQGKLSRAAPKQSTYGAHHNIIGVHLQDIDTCRAGDIPDSVMYYGVHACTEKENTNSHEINY